jgi:hypothetical protein
MRHIIADELRNRTSPPTISVEDEAWVNLHEKLAVLTKPDPYNVTHVPPVSNTSTGLRDDTVMSGMYPNDVCREENV